MKFRERELFKLYTRKLALLITDIGLIYLSVFISLQIRFDFDISTQYQMYSIIYKENAYLYILMTISIFCAFGLYKSLWRYASINEMISIIMASFWSNVGFYMAYWLFQITLPRSVYIINTFILMVLIGGVRFSYRLVRRLRADGKQLWKSRRGESIHVLILGAGEAGYLISKEITNQHNGKRRIVGFLDDDHHKQSKYINGFKVLGRLDAIEKTVNTFEVDEIVLAMPSIKNADKKAILERCKKLGISLKILPSLTQLIEGKVSIQQIRPVEIEDLLGRDSIRLDNPRIKDYITGHVVLVTGGGGSIGSELCRQIAQLKPKMLLILDIYENNAYEIQNELLREHSDLCLKVLIGSVRDRKRLEYIFGHYKPQLVFHAAAHKHVPLMEKSPFEAIKNNTLGTFNTAEIAAQHGVKRFVLISTDKAVNPTNIMGASKRLAEIAIQTLNQAYSQTEFVAVRFGNVLGSNGSVIPLFKKQIAKGGPVTVTHPDIIRYFMTIPEAVQLVLQAGSMASGGEIFILDMGEPVRIVNLAEDLIRLSGFEPYKDIDIQFTGLRPGEKLFEELLLAEEGIQETHHDKIFIGKPLKLEKNLIQQSFDNIQLAIEAEDLKQLEKNVKELIPKYTGKKCEDVD